MAEDDEASARLARMEAKLDRLLDEVAVLRRTAATYLGHGRALTYLEDGTSIFVNTDASVIPIHLIRQGFYEQDNIDILLSFLRPDSVCLDIGANLGLFALRLGQRLRPPGRVIAFEPHPELFDLMERTLLMQNGLRDVCELHRVALSDRRGGVRVDYPHADLGGGQVVQPGKALRSRLRRAWAWLRGREPSKGETVAEVGPVRSIRAKRRRLDDILPPGVAVDLVKIDVEGYELAVLRGMRRVLAESPDIVIVMEQLHDSFGDNPALVAFLDEFGLLAHGAVPGGLLLPLDAARTAAWNGTLVLGRKGAVGDIDRRRFSIYPAQLSQPAGPRAASDGGLTTYSGGRDGQVLFFGPYWFLRRGQWEIRLHGAIQGEIALSVTERRGQEVARLRLDENRLSARFAADRDLIDFECVVRATGGAARVELNRIELRFLG